MRRRASPILIRPRDDEGPGLAPRTLYYNTTPSNAWIGADAPISEPSVADESSARTVASASVASARPGSACVAPAIGARRFAHRTVSRGDAQITSGWPGDVTQAVLAASRPPLFASYGSAPASTSSLVVSRFPSGHNDVPACILRFFDVAQVSRILVPLLLACPPYSRRQ